MLIYGIYIVECNLLVFELLGIIDFYIDIIMSYVEDCWKKMCWELDVLGVKDYYVVI